MGQNRSTPNTNEKYRSFYRLTRMCYLKMERAQIIEISKKQAKEFAVSIYSDIAEYIARHQKEYLEFLEEEKKAVKSD